MECPECGYCDECDPLDWRPYWKQHPVRWARGTVRAFWRYKILRKKRPVLTLAMADQFLRDVYLPQVRDQLNGVSPIWSEVGGKWVSRSVWDDQAVHVALLNNGPKTDD